MIRRKTKPPFFWRPIFRFPKLFASFTLDKMLVGELLSVAMRGGGHKGVLGTILSYCTCDYNKILARNKFCQHEFSP